MELFGDKRSYKWGEGRNGMGKKEGVKRKVNWTELVPRVYLI